MSKFKERKSMKKNTGKCHRSLTRRKNQNEQQTGYSKRHATYREMVTAVLEKANPKHGLGFETILSCIRSKYKIDYTKKVRQYLKSCLTKGVNTGYFKIIKAATGVVSYKLCGSKTLTKKPYGKSNKTKRETRKNARRTRTNETDNQRLKPGKKTHLKTTCGSLNKVCPETSMSNDERIARKRMPVINCAPLQRNFRPSATGKESDTGTWSDDLSNTSMEHFEPVLVKAPSDDADCYIVGLDVTEDGRIIVTDLSNKNIKLFGTDGTWLMSRSLSARPSGYNAVAVINNEEAFLNIWSEGKLHILDLKTRLLETKATVLLQRSLLSVCCYQDQIFATSGGVGVACVMRMDRQGTVYWSTSWNDSAQCLFKSPYFSICFQDGDRLTVLVADDGNGTITSLDGSTGEIFKVFSTDNKRSVGPIAYGRGLVYIWNPEGKQIDVWTTNLENKRTVISDLSHGISGCMKYCKNRNHLLLTYGWFSPSPNVVNCYARKMTRD